MIENYFVILVTHLKSLVGNIVGMTHAIFKIETNVKKIYFFFQRQCTVGGQIKLRHLKFNLCKSEH
jgi:hypothetical protein